MSDDPTTFNDGAGGDLSARVDELLNDSIDRQITEQRNLNRLVREVNAAMGAIQARMDELQSQLHRDIAPTADRLAVLETALLSLRDDAAEHDASLRHDLRTTIEAFRSVTLDSTEDLARNLGEDLGAIAEREVALNEGIASLEQAVESSFSALTDRQVEFENDINRLLARLTDSTDAADALRDQFAPQFASLRDGFATLEATIQERVADAVADGTKDLVGLWERLDGAMSRMDGVESVLIELREAGEEQHLELRQTFSAQVDEALRALAANDGETVARQLDLIRAELREADGDRAASLSAQFEHALQLLREDDEARTIGLRERIDGAIIDLRDEAEADRRAVGERLDDAFREIEGLLGSFTSGVDATTSRSVESIAAVHERLGPLERRQQDLLETLHTSFEAIQRQLGDEATSEELAELRRAVDDGFAVAADNRDALTTGVERLAAIEPALADLRELTADRVGGLQNRLDGSIESLRERIDGLAVDLQQGRGTDEVVGELATAMETTLVDLRAAQDDTAHTLREQLTAALDDVRSRQEELATELASRLSGEVRELADQLDAARLADAEETDAIGRAVEQLRGEVAEATSSQAGVTSAVTAQVQELLEDFLSGQGQTVADLHEAMGDIATDLRSSADAQNASLANRLEQAIGALRDADDERGHQILATLGDAIDDVRRRQQEVSEELAGRFSADVLSLAPALDDLRARTDDGVIGLRETLEVSLEQVRSQLGDLATAWSEDDDVSELAATLDRRLDEVRAAQVDLAVSLRDQLDAVLAEAREAQDAQADEIAGQVAQVGATQQGLVAELRSQIDTALDGLRDQQGAAVDSVVARVGDELQRLSDTVGDRLTVLGDSQERDAEDVRAELLALQQRVERAADEALAVQEGTGSAVASRVQELLEEYVGGQGRGVADLHAAISDVTLELRDATEAQAAAVAGRLDQAIEVLRAAADEDGEAVVTALAGRLDHVADRVDRMQRTVSVEIAQALEDAVARQDVAAEATARALQEDVGLRLSTVAESLQRLQEDVASDAERRRADREIVDGRDVELAERLAALGADVDGLRDGIDDLLGRQDAVGQAVTDGLAGSLAELRADVEALGHAVRDAEVARRDAATGTVEALRAEFAALVAGVEDVRAGTDAGRADLAGAIEELRAEVEASTGRANGASEDLAERLRGEFGEIQANLEALQAATARQAEDVAAQLDALRREAAEASERRDTDSAGVAEGLLSSVTQLQDEQVRGADALRTELAQVLSEFGERTDTHTDHVRARVEEAIEQLRVEQQTVAADLTHQIQSTIEDLRGAEQQRASAIEQTIADALGGLHQANAEVGDRVVGELSRLDRTEARIDEIARHIEQVVTSVDDRQRDLTEGFVGLQQRFTEATEAAEETSERLAPQVAALDDHLSGIAEELGRAVDDAVATVEQRTGGRLEGLREDLARQVADATDRLALSSQDLSEGQQRLLEQFERMHAIEELLSELGRSEADRAQHQVERLDRALEGVSDRQAEVLGRLDGLDVQLQAMREQQERVGDDLTPRLGEIGGQLDQVREAIAELRDIETEANAGLREQMSATLAATVEDLKRTLDDGIAAVDGQVHALADGPARLTDQLTELQDVLQNAVGAQLSDQGARIESQLEESRAADAQLDDRVASMGFAVDRLLENVQAGQADLTEEIARLVERMAETTQASAAARDAIEPGVDRLETIVGDLTAALTGRVEELAATTGQDVETLRASVNDSAEHLEGQVLALGQAVRDALLSLDERQSVLGADMSEAVHKMVDAAGVAERAREELTPQIERFQSAADALQTAVAVALGDFREETERRSAQMEVQLSAHLEDLLGQMDTAIGGVIERVPESLAVEFERVRDRLDEQLSGRVADTVDRLDERSGRMAEDVDTVVGAMEDTRGIVTIMGERVQELVSLLGDGRLTGHLDHLGERLLDIEQAVTDETVVADRAAVREQLADLRGLIEDARPDTQLAEIQALVHESRTDDQLAALQDRIEVIDAALRDDRTLAELGRLGEQLEDVDTILRDRDPAAALLQLGEEVQEALARLGEGMQGNSDIVRETLSTGIDGLRAHTDEQQLALRDDLAAQTSAFRASLDDALTALRSDLAVEQAELRGEVVGGTASLREDLTADVTARLVELREDVGAQGTGLRDALDGLVQTLRGDVVEEQQALRDDLLRQVQELNDALLERDAIADQRADAAQERVAGLVETLRVDLAGEQAQLRDQVATEHETLRTGLRADLLDETTVLRERLDAAIAELRHATEDRLGGAVADLGGRVEDTLADLRGRTDDLHALVSQAVARIDVTSETNEELLERLGPQATQFDDIATRLDENLQSALRDVQDGVAQALAELDRSSVEDRDRLRGDVTTIVGEVQGLADTVQERAGSIPDQLAGEFTRLQEGLDAVLSRHADHQRSLNQDDFGRVTERLETMSEEFATQLSRLASVEDALQGLQHAATHEASATREGLEASIGALEERVLDLRESNAQQSVLVRGELQERLDAVSAALDSLRTHADDTSSRLQGDLSGQHETLSEIHTTLVELGDRLGDDGLTLEERLRDQRSAVDTVLTQLEQLRTQTGSDYDTLRGDVQDLRAIAARVEEAGESLGRTTDEQLSGVRDELGRMLDEIAQYQREQTVAVANDLRADLASVSRLVDERTTMTGQGVGTDAFVDDLEEILGAGLNRVQTALDAHISGTLTSSLAASDASLRERLDRVDEQMQELLSGLTARVEDLDGSLNTHVQNLSSSVVDRLAGIAESLDVRLEDLRDHLSGNLREELEAFGATHGGTLEDLRTRTDHVASALDAQSQMTNQTIERLLARVEESAEASQQSLGDVGTSLEGHLSSGLSDVVAASDRVEQALAAMLRDELERLRDEQGARLDAAREAIDALSEAIDATSEAQDASRDAVLDRVVQEREAISAQIATLGSTLDLVREDVTHQMPSTSGIAERVAADVADTVTPAIAQLRGAVEAQISHAMEERTDASDRSVAAIRDHLAAFDRHFRDELTTVEQLLEQHRTERAAQHEAATAGMADLRTDMQQALRDSLDLFRTSVEGVRTVVSEQLDVAAQTNSTGLTDLRSELAAQLDEQSAVVRTTIETNALDVQRTVTDAVDMATSALRSEVTGIVADAMEDVAARVERHIEERLAASEAAIDGQLVELRDLVDRSLERHVTASAEQNDELAATVNESVERVDERIARMDEEFEDRLARTFLKLDNVEAGVREQSEAARATSADISDTLRTLDSQFDLLRAGLEADQTIALEAVVEASKQGGEVLDAASARVEQLGATLDAQRAEFAASYEAVLAEVRDANASTVEGTADRIDQLGATLEAQRNAFDQAFRDLLAEAEHANGQVVAGATERIEALGTELARQREAFEAAFRQSLQDASRVAADEAKGVTRSVRSAVKSLENLTERVERIEAEVQSRDARVDRERERVTHDLFEQIAASLSKRERRRLAARLETVAAGNGASRVMPGDVGLADEAAATDFDAVRSGERIVAIDAPTPPPTPDVAEETVVLGEAEAPPEPETVTADPAADAPTSSEASGKRTVSKKAVTRKTASTKPAPKKAVTKKAVTKKAVGKKAVGKKATAKKATAKKATAKKASTGPTRKRSVAKKAVSGHGAHRTSRRLSDDDARQRLLDIRGIGPAKQELLLESFGSFDAVAKASVQDLTAVKGISADLAREVKAALKG